MDLRGVREVGKLILKKGEAVTIVIGVEKEWIEKS